MRTSVATASAKNAGESCFTLTINSDPRFAGACRSASERLGEFARGMYAWAIGTCSASVATFLFNRDGNPPKPRLDLVQKPGKRRLW
jgi:hypothetical protein